MMWDFGDQTYTPGDPQQRTRAIEYTPQQSTYPPLAEAPTPFMPLTRSVAPRYEATSSYSSTGSAIYDIPRSQGPVEIDITYDGTPRHHHHSPHRRHSHSATHHHLRPSGVVAQAHSSSYQPPPPVQYNPPAAQPSRHSHSRPSGAAAQAHSNAYQSAAPVQYSQPAPAHHFFQYSKCTGRKKALCVGINYYGMKEELKGCINDAKDVANFLINHWGYKSQDIVVLSDDAADPRQRPTRQNIIDAMHWLVKDAHQHDSLFFHYSGHGSQVKDLDGDEVDGFDEVILPVDFRKSGIITDDLMHEIMVNPLPPGCRLTAIYDSCHSGTALDLPYIYHSNGRLKGNTSVHPSKRRDKDSPADVISFSACKDEQTSADTVEDGVPVGAMSYAFVKSLRARPRQTYLQLLLDVREILRRRYSQKPQLSSSHRIDTGLQFIM